MSWPSKKANAPSLVDGPGTITQEALRGLYESTQAKRQYGRQRQELLALANAGADIEAGEYRLMIEREHRVYLSFRKLVDAFGEEEAERITSSIAATEVQIVLVTRVEPRRARPESRSPRRW
ncbi:MAG: hypothetical protein AB7O38_24035 [Pirellulaceae bacterium]